MRGIVCFLSIEIGNRLSIFMRYKIIQVINIQIIHRIQINYLTAFLIVSDEAVDLRVIKKARSL